MVEIKNPEVIEVSLRFITTDVIYPDEETQDGAIDDDGAASYEECESGLVQTVVSTGVTEAGNKEVGEVHQAVKYSSLLSHMLIPIPY